MEQVVQQFLDGMRATTPWEYAAVFLGIASTFLSKLENIWVYPTGIISTVIYIFISLEGHLFAEAGLNIYYTLMSIHGWWLWSRKGNTGDEALHITRSNTKDWLLAGVFFLLLWSVLFFVLRRYTPSTVPLQDAMASSSAYTAMFLMNRKKIESWYWWIFTDLLSMPLYFSKGYVFTSVQFLVFLLISVSGLFSWIRKHKELQMRTL